MSLLPARRHLPSDYLTAAVQHGFQLRSLRGQPATWPADRWTRRWCSADADAAYTGTPAAIIWHFRRSSG